MQRGPRRTLRSMATHTPSRLRRAPCRPFPQAAIADGSPSQATRTTRTGSGRISMKRTATGSMFPRHGSTRQVSATSSRQVPATREWCGARPWCTTPAMPPQSSRARARRAASAERLSLCGITPGRMAGSTAPFRSELAARAISAPHGTHASLRPSTAASCLSGSVRSRSTSDGGGHVSRHRIRQTR